MLLIGLLLVITITIDLRPRIGTVQYKPSPSQKFGLNATPKSNNGGRFTPVNISGTRKCFNCGASDHLRDRCPKLNRSTTDIAGRSARVSRINTVDSDRRAINQPTTTHGACGQRVTSSNDFHTSTATRGVRHTSSTAARDHTGTAACRPSDVQNSATCDSARVSQSTTPVVTISDQSVQTDNSQAESNSAVSNCVPDVYCNKIEAAVDSDEFGSVNGDLSDKMNQNKAILCPVELSMLKYVEVNVTCDQTSCVKRLLGLCDSGTEVNVINSSVVEDLFPVVRGKIQLKPFFGDSIAGL